MKTLNRFLLSGATIFGGGFINNIVNKSSTVISGELASKQFDDSNLSYIISATGMHYFNGRGNFISVIILGILAIIWWSFFFGKNEKHNNMKGV